ncbi:hypothetical protein NA57DRAFT_81421 [Rhizodiscina lignyota]|uniref:DUF4336 domain-containing protein n=1 Tax=Rhizodiscina lignyota TaxID=1504668 RepID=A0A9P4M3P9_9PEZI|nr:hypothetical protein NA57DRAFT_81421 [Rhizodiscina lignyota]
MTSKLIPPNPSAVMVIRDVTPNIVTCSAPFYRFGRIKVGGRGTIVRLQSGALAVFSPTALTPEVKEKVESLGGDVKYIAATDIEHHIFIGAWSKEYPKAKVIGPEGLPEKRAKQKNEDVHFTYVFTAKNKNDLKIDDDFDANFDYEFVDGHANKELVFNYKPERTLIEADLMFNLPATEQFSKSGQSPNSGILTKIFIYLNGTAGAALAQKRLIWYGPSSANKPSFNKSVDKIAKWDFDRIIPCHGDVIETDGKGIFEKIMEWHIKAANK